MLDQTLSFLINLNPQSTYAQFVIQSLSRYYSLFSSFTITTIYPQEITLRCSEEFHEFSQYQIDCHDFRQSMSTEIL